MHQTNKQGPGSDHCRPPAGHERTVGKDGGTLSSFNSHNSSSTKQAQATQPARERLKALRGLPLLDITPEVTELASRILASGQIPRKAAADAANIAITAVHGMDFLVTWNCGHAANATNAWALARICREHGYQCPVICTRKNSGENGLMVRDPIVDEARRVREELAARYGFDVKAILAASKKRQGSSTHKIVSFVPKKKLSA